jgi:hypothetical protein
MKTLLIVFHSLSGGTRQMAEAASLGARSEDGVCVRLLPASDATSADVLSADGYIFATPENLGAMAGIMKDFFDRTYYAALDLINDGHNAARQIARIATGWRLRPIAEPIIVCTHAQTAAAILASKVIGDDELACCTELGTTFAAGMTMGVF